jgi:protein-L-isoaspartate(D-aspartate) O-methyltransferase
MNTQIDFEQARFNMIEQQIRTWEVLDQSVLDLLYEIHREDFVPAGYQQLALADTNIPLANAQVMMTPKLEARLLQAVAVQANDRVLEIGTGSAYLTALLAKTGQHVDSIDIFPEFVMQAEAKLKNYCLDNVTLHTGDALGEWKNQAPYDVIVVSGSIAELDLRFQQQLAMNGRLFVIVGKSPAMEARLITRVSDQGWSSEALFETDLPALIGAEEIIPFRF